MPMLSPTVPPGTVIKAMVRPVTVRAVGIAIIEIAVGMAVIEGAIRIPVRVVAVGIVVIVIRIGRIIGAPGEQRCQQRTCHEQYHSFSHCRPHRVSVLDVQLPLQYLVTLEHLLNGLSMREVLIMA
jgi:hypothetical protein